MTRYDSPSTVGIRRTSNLDLYILDPEEKTINMSTDVTDTKSIEMCPEASGTHYVLDPPEPRKSTRPLFLDGGGIRRPVLYRRRL